jgi:hypothetical protein
MVVTVFHMMDVAIQSTSCPEHRVTVHALLEPMDARRYNTQCTCLLARFPHPVSFLTPSPQIIDVLYLFQVLNDGLDNAKQFWAHCGVRILRWWSCGFRQGVQVLP